MYVSVSVRFKFLCTLYLQLQIKDLFSVCNVVSLVTSTVGIVTTGFVNTETCNRGVYAICKTYPSLKTINFYLGFMKDEKSVLNFSLSLLNFSEPTM